MKRFQVIYQWSDSEINPEVVAEFDTFEEADAYIRGTGDIKRMSISCLVDTANSDVQVVSFEDDIRERLEDIEKRLVALENKRPEYVPPPVYGPIKRCPNCGQFNPTIFHVCGETD